MIQIQGRQQFKGVAERLQRERMAVRRYEAGAYSVTNKAKGHDYIVRFVRIDGRVFGSCTCEAGHPSKGSRVPMVCKHLLAAVIYHRALVRMRRAAQAAPVAIPAFVDTDDADAMEANW